jgi:magnesium-transporting ATPase (P-type)
MNEWIFISVLIIAVLVLIGLIVLFVVLKKKKDGNMGEPNYQVFFILGTAWLPIGVVFMLTINLVIGIAFMGMGASYMAIGLANRDKWKNKVE